MVSEDELEGFRRDRYFARSWALLTRDRGWIKPVLVMTVALLVPIVGWLGVLGYIYEWARLTAWGVNAAPKQKGVRVGECIKSGARVFVVLLAWGVVIGLVGSVLDIVPLIGPLLSFAWTIFSLFLGMLVAAAALRATIYQKLGAGFRIDKLRQMASHDPSGLIRIAAIEVVAYILAGMVMSVVVLVLFASILPELIYMANSLSAYGYVMSESMQSRLVIQFVLRVLGAIGPTLVILAFVGSLFAVVVLMVCVTAVGLWMRQFNVAAWGRDEDPLPPFVTDPRDASAPQGAAPTRPDDPAAAAPFEGAAAPEASDAPATPAAPSPVDAADEPEGASDDSEIVEVTPVAALPDGETPEPDER